MSNALPLDAFDCPHPCGLAVTSKKQAEQISSHERYLIRLERDVMAVVTDTQAKSLIAAEQLKENAAVLGEVKQTLKEIASERKRGYLNKWWWPWGSR